MLLNCDRLPSIEKIFREERLLNRESNRNSISELKKIIVKEQKLTKEMDYSVKQELMCDRTNWGFSSYYQYN